MKLSAVRTDLNASEDGIDFPLDDKGAKVKIAQWNNKAHQAFLRDVYKKHGRKIQMKMISDEEAEHLLAGQWPHVLKGLTGFTEDDGKTPLQYSPQLIIDLARNHQYKDFFKQIEAIAKDEENYRTENIKALGESLPALSDGQ